MSLWISELRTSDGHLRDLSLQLSPGLNCIIGARGTCKSTIVETIRFLFDDDPKRVAVLLGNTKEDAAGDTGQRGLIKATLKGGTAHLILDDSAKGKVAIDRVAGSEPRVYVDDVVVVDDPTDLLSKIEIYSQGELQEIANSPSKSLGLVDRPNKPRIERKQKQIEEVSREVAALGPLLREVSEAIEASEALLEEGKPLWEELKATKRDRPEMSPEMSDLRDRQQRQERLEQRSGEIVRDYRRAKISLQFEIDRILEICRSASELGDSGVRELEEIATALSEAADAATQLGVALVDETTLNDHLAKAKERIARDSQPYHEALRREAAITDSVKREDRLREEVMKLERVREELDSYRTRGAELMAKRERLRLELRQLREDIFDLRLKQVERINSDFGEGIVLSLRQGTQTAAYRERLVELLDRSRIREREELCEELAAAFPPDALISIVEREDSSTLAKALERDPGQMIRLVSHLADSEKLFELEGELPDDELDVTMYVEGVPRPVSEMSNGQKATAILPLLLRPAEYPLVLDQPEDDLDNRFIFKTLVKRVIELKKERQLIFVTHNANVPVIGNAERVIAMKMRSPEQAELTGVGDVEEMRKDIIELLEGGEEAFELRSKTYDLSQP